VNDNSKKVIVHQTVFCYLNAKRHTWRGKVTFCKGNDMSIITRLAEKIVTPWLLRDNAGNYAGVVVGETFFAEGFPVAPEIVKDLSRRKVKTIITECNKGGEFSLDELQKFVGEMK
jgi:ATP-dependent Zn protease